MAENYELPEICYDEPGNGNPGNPFPFILVAENKPVPKVLFIEIRKETGEIEPGPGGVAQQIVDCEMHKFVDLELLKEKLPPHLNDMVRLALGMKPLKVAQAEGQKMLDKVNENVKKIKSKGKNK
jgi:hypothetical protein